ncbi:hypothetical protein [Phenylobacterium sp. J367]|uniref:hypothetical protein n=1 Tax=Phenylobacterium sp. J367 TaxID=2898435 RepID=UPI00215178B4|nr:hypothetical protein [Phenylobacterium sp. J367]MCR5878843.1 hypothetical protein [Phenylobacterium sp. J367]
MGLLGAAMVAAPGLAHGQAIDLFVERTAMMAADGRCGLFAPEVSQALAAGAAQARGTALRAGVSADKLKAAERDARGRVARVACRSPDMTVTAERVRNAFDGYTRLARMTYPGDFAAWKADRIPSYKVRWRLAQEARFGRDRMTFGLIGSEDAGTLMAVARFADGAEPYGARLVTRDTIRTWGPYLDRYYGGPTSALPLTRRVPPASAQTGYMAQTRTQANPELLADDMKSGWAFRFPAGAIGRLSSLDPREAVVVEFLFAGGTRRAYVEVGDFAAGRAFLTAGSPKPAAPARVALQEPRSARGR